MHWYNNINVCVIMIVQHAMHQTSLSVPMQTYVSMHCTSVTGMIIVATDLMNTTAVSHISVMLSVLLVEQQFNSYSLSKF